MRCVAITKHQHQCRHTARGGSNVCGIHAKVRPENLVMANKGETLTRATTRLNPPRCVAMLLLHPYVRCEAKATGPSGNLCGTHARIHPDRLKSCHGHRELPVYPPKEKVSPPPNSPHPQAYCYNQLWDPRPEYDKLLAEVKDLRQCLSIAASGKLHWEHKYRSLLKERNVNRMQEARIQQVSALIVSRERLFEELQRLRGERENLHQKVSTLESQLSTSQEDLVAYKDRLLNTEKNWLKALREIKTLREENASDFYVSGSRYQRQKDLLEKILKLAEEGVRT